MINWKHIIYNFSFIKAALSDFWPLEGSRKSYKQPLDILSNYKILGANFLAHICLFHQIRVMFSAILYMHFQLSLPFSLHQLFEGKSKLLAVNCSTSLSRPLSVCHLALSSEFDCFYQRRNSLFFFTCFR